MSQEEIHDIEVGDKFYVTEKIYKRIFNSPWYQVYKPDKFYTVFKIDKTKTYIRLTTSSEVGLNKILVYKLSAHEPPFTHIKSDVCTSVPIRYMQHFNLVKQKDYQEISNIDYFVAL